MILPVSLVFILVFYSAACLGGGTLALQILTYRSDTALKQSAGTMLATAFILGQGLLASLWLLLALVGWFSGPVVTGIVVILALSGVILAWNWLRGFTRQVVLIWRELRSDTWGWQSLAGLTLLLCLAWITSIGRPSDGDASAFYMALSKVVAASQRLVPLPGFEGFTNTGLQGEMHYAALMALKSPDAARMFSWPTILAGAVILLALGRQGGLGRRGQWIALAGLFTSSAVIYLSGDGKTDLFAVSFGLAAYYWVLQVRNGPRRLALWLTGLFSGFAIAAKLSYLPVMAPGIVLLLVWQYWEDFRDPIKRKQVLITISIAGLQIFAGLLLAFIPHLIQNGILYHNPFSPFGSNTMGWADQLWFGPETTRRIVLTYPLALTFGMYWAQYGDISPLVLGFLPLAFLLPRPRSFLASPLMALTLAALAGLVTWIVFRPSVLSPRYILAVLLLFILLPARAAEFVSQNDSRPRWLTAGVMGVTDITLIVTGLYFLGNVFYPFNTYQYLTGNLSECERGQTLSCKAMTAINRAAKPGDRVYLASWQRYWLRPDLIQCLSNTEESNLGAVPTPEEGWAYLYQHGFRFLLVDRTTHSTVINALALPNPPPWLKLKLLYSDKNAIVQAYQIEWINPPGQRLDVCRQISLPAWDVVEKK